MKSLRSSSISAVLAAVVALFFAETMLHCADHAGLLAGGHSHHHGCEELPFPNEGDNAEPAHSTDGHSHSAALQDSLRWEGRLPICGTLNSPNVLPPPGSIREITLPPQLS
ncbi:MAG TPA: hypothetical protein VIT91_01240 [Chthoniobacterales bacterium]